MIPGHILKTLISPYGVSESELDVLELAIEGIPTGAIAEQLQIKPDAVRKRLGEIYKKFGISGGGPGKLARLQQILIAQCQADPAPALAQPIPEAKPVSVSASYVDWGEAVDVSSFCGRTKELSILHTWMITERCRLLALLGMGGIGKTSLSVKIADQVKEQFEAVVWRSLRNAPPIEHLLADLIVSLSQGMVEPELPATLDGRIAWLIDYFRKHRCLVVLDNFETVLKSGERAGHYQEHYDGYGTLINRIGQATHTSCLIITSREKPKDVASLEGETLPVRSLQLSGLDQQEGQEILRTKGLSGSATQWQELIEHYRGNPLALKVVATAIQDLFGGDIEEFLQQSIGVFGEIRDLLDQQFNRLFDLEKEIMYWLAINDEPVSLAELRKDVLSTTSPSKLLEALESLRRRGIIEHGVRSPHLLHRSFPNKNGANFTLQPVVMEYIIERLIEQVCHELITGKIDLINRYALIKAEAKDYIRNAQVRIILKPILEQLTSALGGEKYVVNQLNQILAQLHQEVPLKPGYAGGNSLNLLVQTNTDLRGYDFSGLTVWQAYLQDVSLPQVNFAQADLARSVFAETFGGILSLAFNSNGEILATGDTNGKIRLQIVDGEQLFVCDGHTGWVRSVVFSPTGDMFASSSDDQTVKLWQVGTGERIRTLVEHMDSVRSVRFSPDGATLASGSDDQTIKLWDVATGQCLKTLRGHTGRVRSVAFNPNGQQLVSGSSDRTLRLWDIATGECTNVLGEHAGRILSVNYSPDGATLVSGSIDQTIRLWDVSHGGCFKVLRGHMGGILSVKFSFDGHYLASGSDDQTVKLWNVATGDCLNTLSAHTNRVWAVAFSPTDQILASGSDDQTVRLWDVNTRECLRTLQGYSRGVRSVAFSPDSRTLASGGEDRMVLLWDMEQGKCINTFQGHTRRVWCVSFSPDGQTLASGSDDQTVRLWHVKSGECYQVLRGYADWIRSIAFSPDGRLLVSSGDDRLIQIWNVATGEWLQALEGHKSWVRSVSFSPNGEVLASGSNDRTVRLWDTHTWSCLGVLVGHTDSILTVAFSPDGQILASGGIDQTVRLWDMGTGERVKILHDHENWVRSVAFAPQPSPGSPPTPLLLASGSGDQTVKLWDVRTGECLKTFQEHRSRVRSVAFSPDGQFLASGSNDEVIRLWAVETGDCVKTLKLPSPYEGMDITGAKGLTNSYKAALVALGAIDRNVLLR